MAMYNCPECNANNWKFVCNQGEIQGICQSCGKGKTNKWKANWRKSKRWRDTLEKKQELDKSRIV